MYEVLYDLRTLASRLEQLGLPREASQVLGLEGGLEARCQGLDERARDSSSLVHGEAPLPPATPFAVRAGRRGSGLSLSGMNDSFSASEALRPAEALPATGRPGHRLSTPRVQTPRVPTGARETKMRHTGTSLIVPMDARFETLLLLLGRAHTR